MNRNHFSATLLAAALAARATLASATVELQSGEKLELAHLHKTATYRVCVDSFKGSVPLRLFVDGQQSLVDVDSCETVTGRHINVEPAAALPGGDYLVARFKRIAE